MPDFRKIARASMKSLVDSFGCYDAVAETINARWDLISGQGGACKGTISKKVSGKNDWTIPDVIALEDASGQFPITRMLARRMQSRADVVDGCLISDGSSIAKESGEAISAILAAQQSSCSNERAQAVKEIDDAVVALRVARARLEDRMAVRSSD